MDFYIDDMVVNRKKELDHLKDLAKVFEILEKHKLRLNVAKCAFGVKSSKFLRYLVNRQGIEANLKQMVAINELVCLNGAKDVQKLTRMATSLN